jgi:D-glycero-D-manno-heptose 1,7-bisphosphate phosphatase
MKKIIFLDRDEVINKTPTGKKYILQEDEVIFKKANLIGLKRLSKKGFRFIVITNQRCINSGLIKASQLDKIHNFMKDYLFRNYGIEIIDFFYCPHLITDNCECRKPKPGLFLQAKSKYNINEPSIMIGDQLTDCLAAIQANVYCILIKNKNQSSDEEIINSKLYLGFFLNINLAVGEIEKFYKV